MTGLGGAIPGLTVGAPGLYRVADEPLRALTGVRMDVCAFLGVAPRGPARQPFFDEEWAPKPCLPGQTVHQTVQMSVPVAVESWDAYVRLYGGYEGPGLLPYAVSAFFQNGGTRAYIVRIVHQYRLPDGKLDDAKNNAGFARGCFENTGPNKIPLTTSSGRLVKVRARNEGEWGNKLHATLSFTTRALPLNPTDFFTNRFRLRRGFDIVVGAVLRLSLGNGVKVLRRVETLIEDWNPAAGTRELWASYDPATAVAASSAELVEDSLAIDDGVNPTEVIERIGLSSTHPRWLAAVLVNESTLLYPSADPLASWLASDLQLETSLTPYTTVPTPRSCAGRKTGRRGTRTSSAAPTATPT